MKKKIRFFFTAGKEKAISFLDKIYNKVLQRIRVLFFKIQIKIKITKDQIKNRLKISLLIIINSYFIAKYK